MVKLKKYNQFFKLFVIIITSSLIVSCGKPSYQLSIIEGKRIPITETIQQTPEIEKYINPYREHIDADLSAVLAYSPETLDKSGSKWQSPLGNLLADVTLKAGDKVVVASK